MTYRQNISAISFGDVKAAALYFDKVIPIAFRSLRGAPDGLFLDVPEPVPIEAAVKLIFGDDAPRHLVISYMDDYWLPFMKSVEPLIEQPRPSTDPEAYSELKHLYLADAQLPDGTSVRARFAEFARRLGSPTYSVVLPTDNPGASFVESYACLALAQLPLVDTARATWEQILELRVDAEAAAKLRRLRLFFFENYVGKPPEYIQDDLLRRLEGYDLARRKHGFDATQSSIQVLLDSKSLQAAAVASLAAALFGGPIAGLSAGAAVELGKLVLEFSSKRAEIRHLAAGHELGYLIEARSRL